MGRQVKLHAPPGTDEANFGEERFRVDNDGCVEVPEEAVESLTHTGGFTLDTEPVDVPDGMVAVINDGATSCSWGGASYEAREDGSIFVPARAVVDLTAHGFVVLDAPAPVAPVQTPASEGAPEPQA